jgi:polyisoprenoid-binding protein YceI
MEFDHYAIDGGLSSLTLRAFASAAFATPGNNPTLVIREFAGWARFTPRTFEQAYVQIKVNASSLVVVDTLSEEHRNAIEYTMRREVLEIEKYPDILFCSSRVSVSKAADKQYWINLVGDLSLHGVTATLPVAAQVALVDETLRAHGEFTFLHTSFRMKLVPIPGGMLKLKDEVKCSFDILARKQTDLARQQDRLFASERL